MTPAVVAPLFLLVLTLNITLPGHGQWRGTYLSPLLQPGPTSLTGSLASAGPRSAGRLVAGGLLGATAGVAVAMAAYTALDRQDPCLASDCDSDLGSGLVPATAGLTLFTPLGVHLADSRRGSLLKGLLLSAGVAAAVWGGAALADDGKWLLLIPPAQITGAVLVERATAR